MNRFKVHYRTDVVTGAEILRGGGSILDTKTGRKHARPLYSPRDLHETVKYLNAREMGYPAFPWLGMTPHS